MQLSAGISQANFNLRKFKQAHCTRLPKPMPLDEAEPTPVAKIHTEPTILAKESKSLKHSLRSALKITDSFIPAVIKQPNTKLGRSKNIIT